MSLRLIVVTLGLARFAPAQAQACLKVETEYILAGDLAAVIEGFGKIAPETPIAAAPQPGVTRFFHTGELASLAKRRSIEIEPSAEVCVERAMEGLDRTRVLEAMRAALPLPDLRIEIVDSSAYPVPRGRIEFRREGIRRPAILSSNTPVDWRGSIIYSENRRFSIWAKVLLSARMPRVVAAENLKRGEPIGVSQVAVESAETFPDTGDVAQSLDQVVGRTPLRNIPRGDEIHAAQLTTPLDVGRGEMIQVEVRCGAAHISLMGKAESGGRSGDMIAVRNPSSNKIFQARVNGKSRALVDAETFQGN